MKNKKILSMISIFSIFLISACGNKKLSKSDTNEENNISENRNMNEKIDLKKGDDTSSGEGGIKDIKLPETFENPSVLFNALKYTEEQSRFCRLYYDKNIRDVLRYQLNVLYTKDINNADTGKSAAVSSILIATMGTFIGAIDDEGCEKDPSNYVKTVYEYVVKTSKMLKQ